MNPFELRIGKSAKILIIYLAILTAMASAGYHLLGPKRILTYATESKPYSLVFSKLSHEVLLNKNALVDVIFFGDSNYFYPPDRTFAPDPETVDIHLPELVRKEMRARGLPAEAKFSEWAYAGADMFGYYCLFHRAADSLPDLIVVPINWRAFSPAWVDSPKYFHPELSALAPLNRHLPRSYEDPISHAGISMIKQIGYKAGYLHLYVVGFEIWVSEVRKSAFGAFGKDSPDHRPEELTPGTESSAEEVERRRPRSRWTKDQRNFYPMRISDSNKSIQRLRTLAYVASKSETKMLFFIWPMDTQFLADIGVLDETAIEGSKKVILEAIGSHRGESIFFSDLSDLLRSEHFYDKYGHCTIEGREEVAKALAPQILEILEEGNDVEFKPHE